MLDYSKFIFTSVGIACFIVTYLIQKQLKDEEFYDSETSSREIFVDYRLLGVLHALISPWAYFKPNKTREGWFLLILTTFFMFSGVYFLIKGLTFP